MMYFAVILYVFLSILKHYSSSISLDIYENLLMTMAFKQNIFIYSPKLEMVKLNI